MNDYQKFLSGKAQLSGNFGFEPLWLPDFLFDFQKSLVEWAIRNGRAALFEDCGMGKTPQSLVWAENIVRKTGGRVRKTGGRVLILTPLAVGHQTVSEARKFGIEAAQCRDGKLPAARIVVTNYERLHYFSPTDFDGVVCDEASILKNHTGATRIAVTAFVQRVKYLLLCTATPSPNDHTELGNSVEALGVMRRVEMLASFFIHDSGDTGVWRLKGHANSRFWAFVASWARAIRRPSDLGFENKGFVLPPLRIISHVLASRPREGELFSTPAFTLNKQRAERRQSLDERCEQVATLANNKEPFFAWCSLNVESALLTKLIDGAQEIRGESQTEEEKEEILAGFIAGTVRAIVSKSSMCGFGLNLQRCHSTSFFPSHSQEQFYQSVRRFWRFGQHNPVSAHLVYSEAEQPVVDNLLRKERESEAMFEQVVEAMREFYENPSSLYRPETSIALPSWM